MNRPALAERKIEIIIKSAPWWSSAAWLLYFGIIVFVLYTFNRLYLKARTNHLRLLEEQRETEREKRAKEMNMKFFANISHEFRNPLTIIAGPLMMLNADKALPDSVHRILNHVCISVNRMLRLIDQMLDFNQLETDELRLRVEEVDAAKELRQQVASFEESARVKGIKLELVIKQGNYLMWLDGDKVEKIMGNLFTNALKHTSPGGVIRISAHVDDDILKVSVFNSGKLMAEDRMQDVFKRYYQLADSQDSDLYGWGTGIGLYYVKRLVELHHGSVRVNRKFMDELYGWMEKRSAEQDLNVATVCRDMLISPAKFNYKIKELTGETPGIFFRKYKLNKAAAWLREGKYSISEIAVLTGFSTAAHFSVAFKKQFGVSPSEYL